jgi:hypothetical protein
MSQLGIIVALVAVTPAAAVSPDPKDLAVPPAEVAKARTLVGKLASEDFDVREDAQDGLAKMGRLALPALLGGVRSHPSPEVRFRCQSLLPKASALDLQARLDTFLADTDGKFEHDLPGWNEFRKLSGDGTAARKVFVGMLGERANRELVLAAAGPPAELGPLVAARKQEMYYWRYPRAVAGKPTERKDATAADVLALMFAEVHAPSKFVPRTINSNVVYMASGFTTALNDGGGTGKVYQAVVGKWMDTRDDAISMNVAISLANSIGLEKHGSAVAARLVRFKGATITYRLNAALSLAQHDAREHLPALEAVFDDEAGLIVNRGLVAGNVQVTTIQMRDTALAAALLLTDQEPRDYGFTETVKARRGMRMSYTNWRLAEDKRKAAFAKWKAWRAEHPDHDAGKK